MGNLINNFIYKIEQRDKNKKQKMADYYLQKANMYQKESQSIEFRTKRDRVIAPATWHSVANRKLRSIA